MFNVKCSIALVHDSHLRWILTSAVVSGPLVQPAARILRYAYHLSTAHPHGPVSELITEIPFWAGQKDCADATDPCISVIDPFGGTASIVPKVIHKLCTLRTWLVSLCEALVTTAARRNVSRTQGLGSLHTPTNLGSTTEVIYYD